MSGAAALLKALVPPGLSFGTPQALWLLLLLPLAIGAKVLSERRGATALVVPTLAPVLGVRRSWRVKMRFLPFALGLLGYAGLVLGLARPRLGLARTESWTEGVDILIALDASGSMAAEDFKPKNRFTVAKACTRQFVEGRPNDRLGLLVFGGRSRTVTPLTTDRQMLLERLGAQELGTMGDGTAIGLALGNALARLRPSRARSKVVILVTDGGNNAGEIEPDTASSLAKALGVRVYTVGVGTDRGPVDLPVPVKDPETGRVVMQRVKANVDVDEKLLQRIAGETGGRFFRATDAQGLVDTFAAIDRLEKTTVKTTQYTRWREVFPAPVTPAAGLLVAAGLLAAFVLPVAPR